MWNCGRAWRPSTVSSWPRGKGHSPGGRGRVRYPLAARDRAEGRRAGRLADLAAACGAPAYVVPEPVAERLTGYHAHRGALAAIARRPLPAVAGVLGRAGTPVLANMAGGHANVGGAVQRTGRRAAILVLEDIIDHGNVGGIFRCAAALGVDAVILSPRCGRMLYRRAIKVSMGAVFAIPYAR